jgi:hypothetical protein
MNKNAARRCKECEKRHQDAINKSELANRAIQVFGEVERKVIKSLPKDDESSNKRAKKKY